jgi:hypothetical protein
MEAYRLTYRLLTPIVLGEFPITLDALAYAALFARSADAQWSSAQLRNYFLFSDGVPHASALAFGRTRKHSVIARAVPAIGGLRSTADFDASFVQPFGRNGGYAKVKIEGGPYKFRNDMYRGYWSPFVSFDFVGDRERIEILLDSFLIGIGARAQIGAGQVADPSFVRRPRDTSLIDGEMPSRPLPAEFYTRLTGADSADAILGRCTPPYWRQGNQLIVTPERVRIVNF